MIRVLVAEDSLTVRKYLVEVLSTHGDFEVVGEAANGQEAIEMCRTARPDVVSMDLAMPVMSGLAATEYIMAYCPTPILIVSSSFNRRDAFQTLDALAAGAVDVLEKPDLDETRNGWEPRYLNTVRLVSRIQVMTHLKGRMAREQRTPRPPTETPRLVAFGASTGGPGALLQILRALPKDFPLPIVMVVHIADAFGVAFVEWLDGQVPMAVSLARHGDRLTPSRVLVAPPGRHMTVHDMTVRLVDAPPRHFCIPSVDVLFESVAEQGAGAVACLLTGMGRDGAEGLRAIRQRGGITAAQDEETSVIFGMPQEAIRLDAAAQVLALPEFAPWLIGLTAKGVP